MPRFEQREVMSREWAELLDHVCRRLENGEAAADAINDLAASGVVFFSIVIRCFPWVPIKDYYDLLEWSGGSRRVSRSTVENILTPPSNRLHESWPRTEVLYLRNCVRSQRGIIESLRFLAQTRLGEDRIYPALRWALNDVTTETCLVALHWHQFGIGKLTDAELETLLRPHWTT
jgi:hypothetical protein